MGDSLAMPRLENEEVVRWEKTWPVLLKRSLGVENHEIINFSKRAYETTWLNDDFTEAIEFIHPDILIIQVGVVDASPRIISKKEKKLFNQVFFPKWLAKLIIADRKKRRQEITQSNPLKKVYTPPVVFKKSRKSFFERCLTFNPNLEILQIPILSNLSVMENKSSGYSSNISRYNEIIESLDKDFSLKSLHNLLDDFNNNFDEFFLSDGYHINECGHKKISEYITKALIRVERVNGKEIPESEPIILKNKTSI